MSAFSPAAILYSSAGTAIAALTTNPVGTELALIVRTIPSGTQTIAGTVAQGSPAVLANAWPIRIGDGTNEPIITNTDPTIAMYGLTVRNIPSGIQQVLLDNDTLNTNFEVGVGAPLKSVVGIIGGSDYSGGLPSGGAGYPLRVDTGGVLSVKLGPPTTVTDYAYVRQTDGTNAITLINSYPTGAEYALPVRSVDGFMGTVDAGNSTSTPLGSNGVFTGTTLDMRPYAMIQVLLYADQAGTISCQWSNDGITWDSHRTFSIPASTWINFSHSPHGRYFRTVFTNGPVAQGTFTMQLLASKGTFVGEVIPIDAAPVSGCDVLLTKSVLAGKKPVAEGGSLTTPVYTEVAVDANGHLLVAEASTHAAFGAMLVATENLKINLQFPYAINSRLVNTTVANGGTVTQNTGRAMLQTSAAANGSAKMESIDTIKYTPGQGIICRFTSVFSAGVANSVQEIGIGDDLDGYFFGFNGTAFGINRRVGGVDNWVTQTAWNGNDKFDGTGPSGHVLDPTKGYPYQIQFQWLGFGAIRYFVEDPTTGDFVLVHTIKFAGTSTVPSVNNPTLPLHAKVVNTTNATNVILYTPSMGALTEGLSDDVGSNVRWAFTNSSTTIVTAGRCLFSLQNKTTNVLGGVNTNRVIMHVDQISFRSGNTDDLFLVLYKNATITTPTWVDVSTAQSVAQTDRVGTSVGTGGIPLMSFTLASNTSETVDLTTYQIRIHPGETLSFVVFNENTGNAPGRVATSWHEEF